jgi:hypothetical protein
VSDVAGCAMVDLAGNFVGDSLISGAIHRTNKISFGAFIRHMVECRSKGSILRVFGIESIVQLTRSSQKAETLVSRPYKLESNRRAREQVLGTYKASVTYTARVIRHGSQHHLNHANESVNEVEQCRPLITIGCFNGLGAASISGNLADSTNHFR